MGNHNEANRDKRVACVIEKTIQRRNAGERIEDQAVIAANPELMPELGAQLRTLHLIDQAEQHADRTHTRATEPGGTSSASEDPTVTLHPTKTLATSWPTLDQGQIPIPRKIGSVRIEVEIGRGGMGVVYRGWDEVLHRHVAVKFLLGVVANKDDPHLERFFGGARAEARVRHPHIVPVHGAGLVDQVPYLVMEFLDGPTLRRIAALVTRLPLAASVKIMWDVSGALAALHERGLIHRDVKPSNVQFDHDGRLFVTDFGLALLRRQSDVPGIAGTPAYMAPEAFDGKFSPQSDVYAMGIMLFELLAGHHPMAPGSGAPYEPHATASLPIDELPDTVPAPLSEIIDRATHKKNMFRYKTAGHFRTALHKSLATEEMLLNGELELKALIPKTDGPTSENRQRADAPTRSSSYFERVSEIAEKKRKAQDTSTRDNEHDTYQDGRESQREGEKRLKTCPQCDYSLAGLPQRHRCPECGFAYDERMVVVRGWARKENRSPFKQAVLGLCWIGVPFGLFNVIGVSGALGILFLIVVVSRLADHLWLRRIRHRQSYPETFVFSSEGVARRRRGDALSFIAWSRFRKIRLRRVGRQLWRVRCVGGWWPAFVDPGVLSRWVNVSRIDGVFEGNRREAAIVRRHMRRFFSSARRTSA